MKRLGRALVILCLGSTSPSIVVFLCWLFTFGQMFSLADGLFNELTQAVTIFTTCATIMLVLVALGVGELDD
jgi:hypothetical protein